MADGLIDPYRAAIIAGHTHFLSDPDTAHADAILAGYAPGRRAATLARKAETLETKLDPDAVKARKDRARIDGQRVEARREDSGNACLAGREMAAADVLASKAYLDAVAARLRESGVPGSLDRLRALALTDLTQGRNPLDRTASGPVHPAGPAAGPLGRSSETSLSSSRLACVTSLGSKPRES